MTIDVQSYRLYNVLLYNFKLIEEVDFGILLKKPLKRCI